MSFVFACFVVRDLCRSGCGQNYYLTHPPFFFFLSVPTILSLIKVTVIWNQCPPRRRSNSIPWCTSIHVILSLRTWHIMISNLQHARSEHRSQWRCGWFPNMFRFSSFCFWDYRVGLYSLCFKGEFQRCFDWEGFYMYFADLSRTTCAAFGRTVNTNYKTRNW